MNGKTIEVTVTRELSQTFHAKPEAPEEIYERAHKRLVDKARREQGRVTVAAFKRAHKEALAATVTAIREQEIARLKSRYALTPTPEAVAEAVKDYCEGLDARIDAPSREALARALGRYAATSPINLDLVKENLRLQEIVAHGTKLEKAEEIISAFMDPESKYLMKRAARGADSDAKKLFADGPELEQAARRLRVEEVFEDYAYDAGTGEYDAETEAMLVRCYREVCGGDPPIFRSSKDGGEE